MRWDILWYVIAIAVGGVIVDVLVAKLTGMPGVAVSCAIICALAGLIFANYKLQVIETGGGPPEAGAVQPTSPVKPPVVPAANSTTLRVNGESSLACIAVHETGNIISGTARLVKGQTLWLYLASTGQPTWEISGSPARLDSDGDWTQPLYQVGQTQSKNVEYTVRAVIIGAADAAREQSKHAHAGSKGVSFGRFPFPTRTIASQCLVRV